MILLANNGSQTWEWDGDDWAQVAGGKLPSRVTSMIFDVERQRAIALVGKQTFEWDGKTWIATAKAAGGRLVYDPAKKRTLLIGKADDSDDRTREPGECDTPQVWQYEPPEWTEVELPHGCSSAGRRSQPQRSGFQPPRQE